MVKKTQIRSANYTDWHIETRFHPAACIQIEPGLYRSPSLQAAIMAGSVFDLNRAAQMRRAGNYQAARDALLFARDARQFLNRPIVANMSKG